MGQGAAHGQGRGGDVGGIQLPARKDKHAGRKARGGRALGHEHLKAVVAVAHEQQGGGRARRDRIAPAMKELVAAKGVHEGVSE